VENDDSYVGFICLRMNRRGPWTKKEQDDLLQWAAEGISVERIAVRLKRTVMAVQVRLGILRNMQQQESTPKQL